MRRLFIRSVIIAAALLVVVSPAWAIVAGQVDDFEDGTLKNWANGGNAPPVVNVTTGGPAGVNDNFMQVTSDGSGGGSFLTVFNRSQWLGNYIGAGVVAIEVDLRNLGNVDLNICLAFKQGTGPGAPGYVSVDPFFLGVGSGWQHATFLIDSADLDPINAPSDFNTFFSGGFAEMRFINSAGADSLSGDVIAGQVGIDNIRAVPEPGAFCLTILGALSLIGLRHRSRRS